MFFADQQTTKLDLVHYYQAVEAPLLRALGGRPVLLQRFPNGAGGPSFFQKRVPDTRPEWLETSIVSTPNGTTSRALVVADIAHVLWAVNMGCLGFHVWPSRASDPEHADELRIDLDPSPGVTFLMVQGAAREVRTLLDEVGVSGLPKTTGNRGIHSAPDEAICQGIASGNSYGFLQFLLQAKLKVAGSSAPTPPSPSI